MASWHPRPVLLTSVALILSAATSQTQAQDSALAGADTTALQTIVVKGARLTRAISQGPLARETTSETIGKKEISDLSDLGRTTEPGLDFIKPKPGRTGGLFIRGLGGPRVAVLVDDIPLPFLQSSARSGTQSPTTGINGQPDTFDFDSLAGVDVLRGADSSKVGSGALAGALAARTYEPGDLIPEDEDWGGIARTGYDSEDRSFGGSLAVARRAGDTSVLFQGSYRKGHETDNRGSEDVIGSSRTEANPMDSERSNLLFKLRHQLDGGHTIGLTAERYNDESTSDLKTLQSLSPPAPAATSFRPGDFSGWDNNRRERVSLDYFYDAPEAGGLFDAASLRLYWQQLDKQAGSYGHRNSGREYLRANEADERDIGLVGSTQSEFTTGDLTHTVSLHGNLLRFDSHQFIEAFPTTTNSQSDIPDVEGTSLGLSLEDRIALGDSGLSLTPGLRFDWHDYRPQASAGYLANSGYGAFGLPADHSDTRVSPKIVARYQATPELELFVQWSTAYRAPTVDELYGNFTNTVAGYASIGNPTLSSETGQGFAAGANWDSGDLRGHVTVFHNSYDNFIDTVTKPGTAPQPARLFTYENRSDVRISGIEIDARKDFANGIFAEGSLAAAYGVHGDTETRLRSVAPVKTILSLGYDRDSWGTAVTGIFSAGMADDDNANTFDAPGYGVFNLTGWWEPESTRGLRLQAGVYNLFDKTYWNAVGVESVNPTTVAGANQPVDYYTEAGRSFRVSLTQRF